MKDYKIVSIQWADHYSYGIRVRKKLLWIPYYQWIYDDVWDEEIGSFRIKRFSTEEEAEKYAQENEA